jgi:hypothetical protein
MSKRSDVASGEASGRRAVLPWPALRWLGCLLIMLAPLAQAADPWGPERAAQIEAAYLVNFVRYTEWPEHAFDAPDSPYLITVVGPPAVGRVIRNVAAGVERINNRPLEVRVLRPQRDETLPAAMIETLRRSHLVYVHASVGPGQRRLLGALRDRPVLTVGNGEGFAAEGGMLGLVRSDLKIGFEANSASIRASGLMVSAKVLKLARHDYRNWP